MAFPESLTTGEIGEVFSEEVTAAGGKVSDTFDDGKRLFMRAILGAECDVKAGDRVHGGVAIRATEEDIWVHPYVFRQVCKNGAIIARAIETRHIERADFESDPDESLVGVLRDAIRACCTEEAFETAVDGMRSAMESKVDLALALAPMLSRLPAGYASEIIASITDRFSRGQDKSRFGLMNAVTSVARDRRDPELRWQLETIGGSIPALVQRRKQARVRMLRSEPQYQ
jgi:hypothetical protein